MISVKSMKNYNSNNRVSMVFLAFISLYFSLPINAQNGANFTDLCLGPILTNSGLGISSSAKIESNKKNDVYLTLTFKSLKHVKETKIQNPNYTNPKPYVYGKINDAATINLGISRYKKMGYSSNIGPGIKLGLEGGASIALTKPYYVYIQTSDDNFSTPDVVENNPIDRSVEDKILGPARTSNGLKNTTLKPGAYLDINLQLEWDKIHNIQRLKTGIIFEYFPSSLNILYKNQNKAFTHVYITYQIGRYN